MVNFPVVKLLTSELSAQWAAFIGFLAAKRFKSYRDVEKWQN
ncbi:hypothetical protein [Spiroplasma citri]|nr:hypothetical protein [Spiroplasma citri]